MPKGLTKSEKKEFRKENRERFAALLAAQKPGGKGMKTKLILKDPSSEEFPADFADDETVEMEGYLNGQMVDLSGTPTSPFTTSLSTLEWTEDETPQSTPAESSGRSVGTVTDCEQSLKSLEL